MGTSTKSLLEQIESAQRAAAVDLNAVPRAVRAGTEMAKNQATQELPRLLGKLQQDTVPRRLIGIVAAGDPLKLTEVALFLEENGGVVLDAGALYGAVADHIETSYNQGERLFRTNQFMGMTLKLEELAAPLGYSGVQCEYSEAHCPTTRDTAAHVRLLVRSTGGGDKLQLAFLARAATQAVVDRSLDEGSLPTLIVDAAPEEVSALRSLCARSVEFEFTAEFQVTKESIIEIARSAR